jgi:S-formylglutathione hydrolase FrmB
MTRRRPSGRTAVACATLALAWLVAPVSAADAGRIVTWKLQSRHVDPGAVEFGRPPLCGCVPHAKDGLYVNVYLPDGYDGRRRFPVLYLLHGGDGQYDSYLGSPRPNDPRGGILPGLAAGFPGIVVMPDGGGSGQYANWWNGGRRGAPAWERFHLDELIPLVERRLRVGRGRRFHAIAGFSMGGYGAAFYASQRPGYFGIAATLSGRLSLRDPTLYGLLDFAFGDPARQRFYWAGHDPVTLARNLRWTRVYASAGDGQALPGEPTNPAGVAGEHNIRRLTERFVGAARRARVSVTFRVRRGEHNHDLAWRSFEAALPWITASLGRTLPDRPRRWSYSTVAQRSEAFGVRFRFGKPPSGLVRFAREGDVLSARGRGRVEVALPGGRHLHARLPFRRLRLQRPPG